MGGPTNEFGSGGMWGGGQHGIHVMALDKILIFNNNSTIMAAAATPADRSPPNTR